MQNKSINIIISYFPQYNFEPSDDFRWSKQDNTIYYNPKQLSTNQGIMLLLHEISHGFLNHSAYSFDIELVNMEATAWMYSKKLSKQFSVPFNEAFAQECIDTYKMWLDNRSTCITCSQTGLQKEKMIYFCFNCETNWKVNDAKFCKLRRYKKTLL